MTVELHLAVAATSRHSCGSNSFVQKTVWFIVYILSKIGATMKLACYITVIIGKKKKLDSFLAKVVWAICAWLL